MGRTREQRNRMFRDLTDMYGSYDGRPAKKGECPACHNKLKGNLDHCDKCDVDWKDGN